jgi:hypothetical protein
MNRRADFGWLYDAGKADGISEGRRLAAIGVVEALAALKLPIATIAKASCAALTVTSKEGV